MFRKLRVASTYLDATAWISVVVCAVFSFAECLGVVFAVTDFVGDRRSLAFGFTLGTGALIAVHRVVRAVLRGRVHAAMLNAFTRRLLHGKVFALPRDEGDLQHIAFDGAHHCEAIFAEVVPSIVGDGLAVAACTAWFARTMPCRLLGLGGGALALSGLVLAVARVATRSSILQAHRAYSNVVDDVVDSVGARLEWIAGGRVEILARTLRSNLSYWRAASRSAALLSWLVGKGVTLAVLAGVGVVLVLDEQARGMTDGHSIDRVAIFSSAVPSLVGLGWAASELMRRATVAIPFLTILTLDRGPTSPAPSNAVPRLPATIRWDDVAFAYGASGGRSGRALSGISMEWIAGELLVMTGPNGAGKSTLVRLLLRLEDPDRGTISVGGVDVKSLDLTAWRQSVFYLPQRPFFRERASVRDAIGSADRSQPMLEDAFEKVGLLDSLRRYAPHDPWSVRIADLSAGERQRVALARFVLSDTPVALLDEPDANLDQAGIDAVCALIGDIATRRMVLVIAHSRAFEAMGRVVRLEAREGVP